MKSLTCHPGTISRMKVLTLLLLGLTVAIAAPQYSQPPPKHGPQSPPRPSPSNGNPEGGNFQLQVEADSGEGPDGEGKYNINFKNPDGTSRQEQGALQGENGAEGTQGGRSFTLPDGTPGEVNFAVGGSGFK